MNKTIGILGGGQLGRMLALAGYPLGLRFRFFDPSPDACAGQVGELVVGQYEDATALARFAQGVDVITYEFENVPVDTARLLMQYAPVYPPPVALEKAQDRLVEKTFFQELGIPTPPFLAVHSADDLRQALGEIGMPAVLKTRRFGYDGKGQAVIRTLEDMNQAWERLGGVPLILEGFVPFEREVSIIAIRSTYGAEATYPLVENVHEHGILRQSTAPYRDSELQPKADTYAFRVFDALDYVGVLAIEFFVSKGRLLANEMAPRVHNSGHWTIDGACTSQFEHHLRAILGLAIGETAPVMEHAMMVNLIGTLPDLAALLVAGDVHLHLYGKEPRPGRKLGHVNLRARSQDELNWWLERVWKLLRHGDT